MSNKKLYGDLIAPVYKDVVDYIFNNTDTFLTLKGGRSSAKGDTAYTCIALVLSKEIKDAFIFAPQQSGLRTGVIQQVEKVLGRIGIPYTDNKSTNVITLKNGSRFIFKGLDVTNSQKNEDVFKGLDSKVGIRFTVFDEVGALPKFSRVDTIINTVIRQEGVQIIEISNPPRNKNHKIFERYKNQELNPSCLVKHTTIFDLPSAWINDKQLEHIVQLKRTNPDEYAHSFLGIATGVDGIAYLVEDDIWLDELNLDDYYDFQIFTDEATVNATTFALYGFKNNGDIVLINTFYHSSKNDGKRYSPSQYANVFLRWIDELNKRYKFSFHEHVSQVVTDGLPFTMELKHLGIAAKSIGKLKNRTLSYNLSNKLISEKSFRIFSDKSNNIFYKQLTNATLIYDREGKPLVDKSRESGMDNDTHTHALDTFLYFCLYNQRMILKGGG